MKDQTQRVENGFDWMTSFDHQFSNEAMRPYVRFLAMIVLFAVHDYARSLLLDAQYGNLHWKDWKFRDKANWRRGRDARRWMLGLSTSRFPFFKIAELLLLDPERVVLQCENDPQGVYDRTISLTAV